MEEDSSAVSFSPSFNSYSSDQLANIAGRVGETLSEAVSDHADEEFEFTPATASQDAEVANFPLFNVDLLFDRYRNLNLRDEAVEEQEKSSVGAPLRELFVEDDGDPPSSSSSEAGELERIEPGTYCIWRPNAVPSPSAGRCEKSNSTGSSRKHGPWRLPKLLRRSRSDGNKYSLGPNNKKKEEREKLETAKVKTTAKKKSSMASTAHEVFYVRSKASKAVDKRKSYLPYRQDLFGFFVNVNGLPKGFPPF